MTDDFISSLHEAFDSDSVPRKNIALKKSFDALREKDKMIAELEDQLEDERYVSKDTDNMFREVRDENIELREYIKRLEEVVQPFIDRANYCDMYCPDREQMPVGLDELRKVREVVESEDEDHS